MTIRSPGVVEVHPEDYKIIVREFWFEESKDQHTASVEAMEWAIGRLHTEIARAKEHNPSSFTRRS